MTVDPIVLEVVDAFLRAVDGEAPGLIEGLYLNGSVALGDFSPRMSDIDFWADPDVLISWTARNLDDYWRPMREFCSILLSLGGLFALRAHAVQEGVLGVIRPALHDRDGRHHLEAGGGLYALEAFPDTWHQLVNKCLRIRRGGGGRSLYWEPLSRRREGLAYMDMVIVDAHRLAAERRPAEPAG